MNPRFRWTIILGALLLAAGIAFVAYNAGLANAAGAPSAQFHHHHPWGFPFFFPLFFIGFWLLAFRGFRGHHHRHCHYDENHPRG